MNADAFADLIIDQFDEMLELSQGRPLVMGVALHAYLIGQPHRLRHLKRALRHVARQRERIWLTAPGAIARHMRGAARRHRALNDIAITKHRRRGKAL